MATRTKGFFEQEHGKRSSHWNRPQHNRAPLGDAPANIPTKPAIPATTEAKTKLKAFSFTAEAAEEPELEESVEREQSENAAPTRTSSSDTPPLPQSNTFPCTPGARLSLEDLIGDCDEVKKQEEVTQSPEEQIGWIPNSSSELLTPNRRKRKRAKSSSPSCPGTSSQAAGGSTQKGQQSVGKTPAAADPAADLWQRYASNKQSGVVLKPPKISNLIFQGSPRPLETPVKGGGLRRWASTGNDWPSSKNKRQRTGGSRTSISVWQDQTAVESGGKSKVASMVKKLQETLATQRTEQARKETPNALTSELPSSSSPLPETGDDLMKPQTVTSPLQARKPIPPLPRPPTQTLRPTVSGGIRFDSSRQAGDPLNPGAAPTYALQTPIAEADEFDDGDFDLTVDDIDELCSQPPQTAIQKSLYDIPPHPDPPQAPKPFLTNAPGRPAQQTEPITIDDDDEFGAEDIDDDSFAQAEFSATQAMQISPRRRRPHRGLGRSPRKSHTPASTKSQRDHYAPRLQRYRVKQVISGQYTDDRGRCCDETILSVEDEATGLPAAITLRGSWATTPVSQNAIVHIAHIRRGGSPASARSPAGQVLVSDAEQSPLLIVHPDHMLSATTVADSFDCIRKAVLQDRIKATSEGSKAMVYGKILHEIFQQALCANEWSESFLGDLVERTIQLHVEGLWELGMRDTSLAAEEVKAKMGEITAWAGIFVQSEPSAAAQVDDKQGEKMLMSISKLIAIEEHVWSPLYGLKGNVDATVQTTIASRPGAPDLQHLIVPFEVKTGRTTQSAAHRAQTALYTLLMSDRYDVEVEAGILYYLESSSMSRIAPPLNEIKQMIQQRNRLAAYIFRARNPVHDDEDEQAFPPAPSQMMQESGLPTMLRNPYKCGRCYAQQSCFAYHALAENGTADSAGMVDDKKKTHSLTWKESVGHLLLESKDTASTMSLKKWFMKWDKLLTLEEGDQARFRKELWTMSSADREASGRCFGRLHLVKDLTNTSTTTQVDGVEGSGGKINRFAYAFSRALSSSSGSFAEGSSLTLGEPIVVSSERGQWALANGYVVGISRTEITVAVDRKLGDARQRLPLFDEKSNQAFRGTMTVGGHPDSPEHKESILYRIDKDEFSNGLALVRNNLVTLMNDSPIVNKLRDQLIFNAAPTFTPTPSMHGQLEPTQLGQMNDDQRSAVSRVLAANDYALILGMPGTGKTTTIAHIIRALLAEQKSILLTSFTHTAVDNILLKIKDIAPTGSILRLGVPAKINPQVQEFCQLAATPRKTIDEVDAAYMGTQIVATTCMGTNHTLFHRRSFDVCIVDEASQITLPIILGPLLHTRKFVLVGDHYQLPPLVQNRRALEGGLDVSLFRQLSESQPAAVAELGRQYRMCEEIMSFSNELIYHGKLNCGNEAVAQRSLHLGNPDGLQTYHGQHSMCKAVDNSCWLRKSTDPQNKVVFANTDQIGKAALETLSGGGKITNLLEATLCAQIVLSFLALGVPASEMGVITLYRSQLALMRQLFRRAGIPAAVEIDSADRYQGRDKEVVILSMVRSNESGIVGDLLKDWRRVNVALTRARSKLVVLGSRRTLKNTELLDKMMNMMDNKGWTMDLPQTADDAHAFDFSTQVAATIVEQEEQQRSPKKKIKARVSPTKRSPSKPSPSQKSIAKSLERPRGVLQASINAGNRSPSKRSPKVVKGHKTGSKIRRMRDEVVMEIWEDLTGEEF
ncbi:Putative PD-(D/E)XK endonuclease-like domain superfamily, DNA replication factor Dna2 [Septoria linicola]|uniref:DNA replication ATP-dependent helicase/nuclease n=1 Tax=Septoria linicola TaxID=215465 RepID=A0A9Q9EEI3_9PEZI|nr:Putative PD-(D/E)XK endonuclease-like domain superfamily, DNA replication factor Dna2 [Septoria linicola]